jgi:peptidoglycan/LPS O-acetylase OafA/YrhL
MFVFLFIVVLLAIAGLLGVVLKAAILIIGTAVLAAAVFAAFAWYWFKHQLTKARRELDQGSTNIRIGQVRPSSRQPLPPERDDRY